MSQPHPASMMTPGNYLRLRRLAAHMTLYEAALHVPHLLDGPGEAADDHATGDEINRVRLVLDEAEQGRYFFGLERARMLRTAFPFDPHVYVDLVAASGGHQAPVIAAHAPMLCGVCACSWHDPCLTEAGPCAWSQPDPDATSDQILCTACAADPGRMMVEAKDGPRPNPTPDPAEQPIPVPHPRFAGSRHYERPYVLSGQPGFSALEAGVGA